MFFYGGFSWGLFMGFLMGPELLYDGIDESIAKRRKRVTKYR